MELNYVCEECGNQVVLDQDYLSYAKWSEGDPYPAPQCKCLHMLTIVE